MKPKTFLDWTLYTVTHLVFFACAGAVIMFSLSQATPEPDQSWPWQQESEHVIDDRGHLMDRVKVYDSVWGGYYEGTVHSPDCWCRRGKP